MIILPPHTAPTSKSDKRFPVGPQRGRALHSALAQDKCISFWHRELTSRGIRAARRRPCFHGVLLSSGPFFRRRGAFETRSDAVETSRGGSRLTGFSSTPRLRARARIVLKAIDFGGEVDVLSRVTRRFLSCDAECHAAVAPERRASRCEGITAHSVVWTADALLHNE